MVAICNSHLYVEPHKVNVLNTCASVELNGVACMTCSSLRTVGEIWRIKIFRAIVLYI